MNIKNNFYNYSFIIVALFSALESSAQNHKWYISGQVGLNYMDMQITDTGTVLGPAGYLEVGIPSFHGGRIGCYIKPRLALETGILDVEYPSINLVKGNPFYSRSSGLGIWAIPLLFNYDLLQIRNKIQSLWNIKITAGLLNQFTSSNLSAWGNNGIELNGVNYAMEHHVSNSPRFFIRPQIGIEAEYIIGNRVGIFLGVHKVFGFGEVFRNDVSYTQYNVKNTGTIGTNGSGILTQLGFRCYFGEFTK